MSYSSRERWQEVGVLGSTCVLCPSCRRAGAGRLVRSGPHSPRQIPQAWRRAQPDWFNVCSTNTACLCRAFAVGSFVHLPCSLALSQLSPTRGGGGRQAPAGTVLAQELAFRGGGLLTPARRAALLQPFHSSGKEPPTPTRSIPIGLWGARPLSRVAERKAGKGPTSPGPVFSGKGASWPLGHSPGGRQAGDRKDLAWLQARLPGTSPVRGPGQGGEEGSGAHWGRFIPETEPSICWVRKLGETDGDKECRQRRKRRIAGARQESAGVGSSRLNSSKRSKL